MRSKLFVPGSRPELFAKAMASAADGISIDLEDAVVEARKAEARTLVGAWLRAQSSVAESGSRKTMIVRVNAMDTPHFADDIAAVVQPRLDIINLPKPASPDAVREACAAIERAERANGVTTPVRLLLNIETPFALREAAALASAHPRVMGLQVGLGDLFEPLNIVRRNPEAVRQVLFAVRMAAGEAGVAALDGAYANVGDTEGFIAEAQMARALGFIGKSCIHPSQIELVNAVFRPTDEEIAAALKVCEAAKLADANGIGAYLVDGKMIDAPFLRRAEAICAQARALGLIPFTA
jgi:citrate lyase subunit beta/citryl-CoA lyase